MQLMSIQFLGVIYLAIICFCFLSYLKCRNQVIAHWPIVDILPCLVQNAHRVHDWTVEISNTYGKTILERGPFFARLEILFTCDPRNFLHITKTNFPNYPKGQEYNEVFEILGDGLFNVDFDMWHDQRNLARTAFSSSDFPNMASTLSKKVVEDELVPLLSELAKTSSIVDLADVFLRYAFDVTFMSVFGRNPKYLSPSFPDNDFATAMDDAFEALFYRHIVPPFWWKFCRLWKIGKEKKLHNAWDIIDRAVVQYISQKKEDLLQGEQVHQADLLSKYIHFQKIGKQNSSDGYKFLRDSALSLLFAGRDTTGSSLGWFFYMVLKTPEAEVKILEELKKVYLEDLNSDKKKPYVFDSGDLKGLVYLHAALCEAIRLYPTLPINRKAVVQEDVLPDGTIVKPGMRILMSTYSMARMESIWGKDCKEYKPERWIDKTGKLRSELMKNFFSFHAGPRICVGKDFAFTMMKTVAAAILFNFHIELVKGHSVTPRPSLILHMKNGMLVRVKPRG